MPNRIIGLDLDGVIRHNNKSLGTGDLTKDQRNRETLQRLSKAGELPQGYYCTKPEDVIFIDGALESLKLFHVLGIEQYVFTNQEAIGVCAMTENDWHFVRDVMDFRINQAGGNISGWHWCPHFPDQNCECRKPKPGMILKFANGYDLSQMIFVGDNPSDMEAAHNAGCGYKVHILLDTADAEFNQPSEYADVTATSLKDAVVPILNWVFKA